jgi:hypothetical protein
MGITGSGSDVAADPCWDEDEETQKAMPLEFKDENCRCMGTNILREESCNFPGTGQFYDPAIDEAPLGAFTDEPPQEPIKPDDPVLPPQPEKPEDESDSIAMAEWQDALEEWNEDVETIQADYEAELALYEAELELYLAQLEDFQNRKIEHERDTIQRQITINSAVLPAEELIRQFEPGFGWTYVDKDDEGAYRSMILKTWAAQLAIIFILFLLTMFVQKRKDVVR